MSASLIFGFLAEYAAKKVLDKGIDWLGNKDVSGALVLQKGKFRAAMGRIQHALKLDGRDSLVKKREEESKRFFRDYQKENLLVLEDIRIAYSHQLSFIPGGPNHVNPLSVKSTTTERYNVDAKLGIPGFKDAVKSYRKGQKHEEPYPGATVRISNWNGKTQFTLSEADYLDQYVTNQVEVADRLLQEIVGSNHIIPPSFSGKTLREIEKKEAKLLPFSESRLSNSIGIAGTVITADGYLVLPRRNMKVHVQKGYEGSSVSGVLEWSKGLSKSMMEEMSHQLCGKEGPAELLLAHGMGISVPLAFARELHRVGKPQFFFHIWSRELLANFKTKWQESPYPKEEYDSIRWVRLFNPASSVKESNDERAERVVERIFSLLEPSTSIDLGDLGRIALSEEARANLFYLAMYFALSKGKAFLL